MNYKKRITLRVTENDCKALRAQAEQRGVKESELLRLLIRNQPKQYPEIRMELANLSKEINYIGHNINQIVYRQNAGFYAPEDREHLKAALVEIQLLQRKVVEKLGN